MNSSLIDFKARRAARGVVIATSCVLILIAGLSRAMAQDMPAAPQIVKVGLYLLNVGKLDPTTGALTADFHLGMKSDRPVPERFEFANGRADSITKAWDKGYEKDWRIQANLVSPLD